MRWRIYYGDGSTYSDRDGSPFDAPPGPSRGGAQAVATEQGVAHGSPGFFYWRDDIGWQACDDWGLRDYLMLHQGPKAVLFGRSLRDEEFWAIVGRATREGLGT